MKPPGVRKKKSSKKDKAVRKAIAAVTDKKTAYRVVSLEDCAPNSWNPNKMDSSNQEKLLAGMKRLLAETGRMPPIIVRPHPDERVAQYQIIDGEHRWKVLRSSGEFESIDAFVLDVDDATAVILTDTLNYLRGEPDEDKYGDYLRELVEKQHMSPIEVATYLPQTADEIREQLESYKIDITSIDVNDEEYRDEKAAENEREEHWVEIRFSVSTSQAEVIEAELARIGGMITGNNVRGRALEYMAVNSAQTPSKNLTGEATGGKSWKALRDKAMSSKRAARVDAGVSAEVAKIKKGKKRKRKAA